MSEAKLASWNVAESPVAIDYSLVVIEEIRQVVAEGFQRLSRGGIEVGGILYGTRDGRSVRVLAMRPIACEHARGPAFLLSDKDRVALNEQFLFDMQDQHLQGLSAVGWFVSHTRGDIALTDSDLEVYSVFFPAPWQVALVVRPGRGSVMRAGFFVREADGTVKSDHSYLDFDFPDRLAGVFDRPPGPRPERTPERRLQIARRDSSPQSAEMASSETAVMPRRDVAPHQTFGQPVGTSPDFGPPVYLPAPPPKKKWPWLVGWALLVLLTAGLGLRYWLTRPVIEPIALTVMERDGQIQIGWNHSARPVTAAVRGSLVINDGSDTRTIPLTPQQLTSGKYTYERKTGDIEVRMAVEDVDGNRTQEASRFLGQPPVKGDSSELNELKHQRDELQAEVNRLKRENDDQNEKIQQLQRTIQIMTARGAVK